MVELVSSKPPEPINGQPEPSQAPLMPDQLQPSVGIPQLSRQEVEQMRAGLSSVGPFAQAILYNNPEALLPVFRRAIDFLPRGIIERSQKTSNQTGISTVTDVTGLSVTWDADPNRLYLTSVYLVVVQNTSAATIDVRLTDASNVLKQQALDANSGGWACPVSLFLYESGLSGSVTRKVRLSTNVATADVSSNAAYPAQILVQDLGLA